MKKIENCVCSLIFCVSLMFCGMLLICGRFIIFDCLVSLQCNPLFYYYWKNVPIDIPTKFYIFNWTNPEDIYNHSVKPRFEELGPYTFLQKEEKCNITWNNNGTVTYQQRRWWYYDPTRSHGSLQDKITNVDPTVLGISYLTRTWSYFVRRGLFLTLARFFTSVHRTNTVSEMLYEGYPEPLIKLARSMPFFAHLNLPAWDRFGWMYYRNGSADFDGVFNMGTGTNSVLGEAYNWNYQSTVDCYKDTCGKVSGSLGQFFPRNLNQEFVDIFTTDLKRKVSFHFAGETTVDNIVGFKYKSDSYMFDNGTLNPDNTCFCSGECTPTGVANVSLARHSAPIFASLPHFYGADPYYSSLVKGLEPNEKKHEFSFTIEPTTGIPIEADAKLQVNIIMQPVKGTELFDDAPKLFFPILWTQQKTKLPTWLTLQLRIVLQGPTICLCVGVLLIICSILLLTYKLLGPGSLESSLPRKGNNSRFANEESVPLHVNKS